MYKFFRLALMYACCAGLFACTSLPKKTTEMEYDWSTHQSRLSSFPSWKARGSVLIVQGNEKSSGRLHWKEDRQSYKVTINNPFGVNVLTVNFEDDVLTLLSEDNTYTGIEAARAVYRATGWDKPLTSLANWMMLDVPFSQMEFGVTGEPVALTASESSPWQVRYFNFHNVNNVQLPKRIEISRGQQQLVLKISRWELM